MVSGFKITSSLEIIFDLINNKKIINQLKILWDLSIKCNEIFDKNNIYQLFIYVWVSKIINFIKYKRIIRR